MYDIYISFKIEMKIYLNFYILILIKKYKFIYFITKI